jgi:hypothetical protein
VAYSARRGCPATALHAWTGSAGPWNDARVDDPDAARCDLAPRRARAALDLWTFQANLGARNFYERHGFAAVATSDGDNEEGAPDIRYHWQRPGH